MIALLPKRSFELIVGFYRPTKSLTCLTFSPGDLRVAKVFWPRCSFTCLSWKGLVQSPPILLSWICFSGNLLLFCHGIHHHQTHQSTICEKYFWDTFSFCIVRPSKSKLHKRIRFDRIRMIAKGSNVDTNVESFLGLHPGFCFKKTDDRMLFASRFFFKKTLKQNSCKTISDPFKWVKEVCKSH